MSDGNSCLGDIIDSNPDISGIGVRTSIYAQAIIGMIVSTFWPNDMEAFKDVARTSYITSFSLILAALIQSQTGDGLSLIDGLIVTMLTTLMTTFVSANVKHVQSSGLSVNISYFLYMTFWVFWGLYVWAQVDDFGNTPECNSQTMFVVFGHSIEATRDGLRKFAIAVFSLGALAALASLAFMLAWLAAYVHGAGTAEDFKDAVSRKLGNIQAWAGLGVLIYLIVTTEQMITRNQLNDATNVWTLGQILAMILLLQQLMDVASLARKSLYSREGRSGSDVSSLAMEAPGTMVAPADTTGKV